MNTRVPFVGEIVHPFGRPGYVGRVVRVRYKDTPNIYTGLLTVLWWDGTQDTDLPATKVVCFDLEIAELQEKIDQLNRLKAKGKAIPQSMEIAV